MASLVDDRGAGSAGHRRRPIRHAGRDGGVDRGDDSVDRRCGRRKRNDQAHAVERRADGMRRDRAHRRLPRSAPKAWICSPISWHGCRHHQPSRRVIAFVTGLVSVYSSTSGVVLPAFLPTVPGLRNDWAAATRWALLGDECRRAPVDLSPLSTIGALCLAALPASVDAKKVFNQLLAGPVDDGGGCGHLAGCCFKENSDPRRRAPGFSPGEEHVRGQPVECRHHDDRHRGSRPSRNAVTPSRKSSLP